MENKLGQEPAFPLTQAETTENILLNGVSKRFYAATKYSNTAYMLANEMSIDEGIKALGLPIDTKWDYISHFPKLMAKLQYILADELLKQENK